MRFVHTIVYFGHTKVRKKIPLPLFLTNICILAGADYLQAKIKLNIVK